MRPVITVAAVDIQCPKCLEFMASPTGSLFFEWSEVKAGEVLTCDACGTKVTVPAMKFVRVK